MSFEYGFYNALEHDRLYDAIQMSKIFDGVISDGVFATVADAMMVKSAGDMDITIGKGQAWFNHTWNRVDALYPMTVEASEVILDRIDTVVLEIDSRVEARMNSLKIIKGTPATSPVAPTLSNSDGLYQYPLADIYIAADITSFTQSSITNRIGTSDCPFVTGLIDTIDIDDLVAQWDAQYAEWKQFKTEDFDTWSEEQKEEYVTWASGQMSAFLSWFANIQYVLDGDVAGHLQNEIDGLINGSFVKNGILFLPFIDRIYVSESTLHLPSDSND